MRQVNGRADVSSRRRRAASQKDNRATVERRRAEGARSAMPGPIRTQAGPRRSPRVVCHHKSSSMPRRRTESKKTVVADRRKPISFSHRAKKRPAAARWERRHAVRSAVESLFSPCAPFTQEEKQNPARVSGQKKVCLAEINPEPAVSIQVERVLGKVFSKPIGDFRMLSRPILLPRVTA
ncbi:hypothetical protein HAX54_010261 [Datura stramonium]|uniref:Uncharacterized protein n=1 Tax=Datura stramonium TaxID=4076 RepID=A0ABS8WZU6_DATST|nr:hypothetical protein [Datura stramonium]